jgi:DNA-binding Lrp family transcriptional regulator
MTRGRHQGYRHHEEAGMIIDELDAGMIGLLAEEPRIGVLECSRRLAVARGTVQARLDRLVAAGVIRGFGPEIDPERIGFGVTAFVTLEIWQGGGQDVIEHLRAIPELLELHTITGSGDMLCRIVARSNADLQRVIDEVVGLPEITRTASLIVLTTPVPHRTLPLVRAAATGDRSAADRHGADRSGADRSGADRSGSDHPR